MRSVIILLRHLLAILVLPFVMVVVIPRWILRANPTHGSTPFVIGGVIFFAVGFFLFAWCLALFASRGKGTLAPWDPPKRLVVSGPYLHVRNPMISGVLAMIIGEALCYGSWRVAVWALAFFVLNQIHFLIFEEPDLQRRFGNKYVEYRRSVPRWIPKL